MAMATTDGGLLPLHVQIFQGLVPQVASQATSLENILRTLCQKIETLESCLVSINSGVVEMDMRLKTIAHNIEGGATDDAFDATSTFMAPLVPTKQPVKSAVVAHVISALAMGHAAKPLEKLKKKRKKILVANDDTANNAPVDSGAPLTTDKPAALNRGHSSARLLRDSPRARSIPEQREMPHTARSKSIVRSPVLAQQGEVVATVKPTDMEEATPNDVDDEPFVQVQSDPWDLGNPSSPPTNAADGHDHLAQVEPSANAPAAFNLQEQDSVENVNPGKALTSPIDTRRVAPDDVKPEEVVKSTTKDATITPPGACIETPATQRRRTSHHDVPPASEVKEAVVIPLLPLPRVTLQSASPLQTPPASVESKAPPSAKSMGGAASPKTAVPTPKRRESLGKSSQQLSTSSSATPRRDAPVPMHMTKKKTKKSLLRAALPQPTTLTSSPHPVASPTPLQSAIVLIKDAPLQQLDVSQSNDPPDDEDESSSECSESGEDSEEEVPAPTEEELRRLKEAGHHGWQVVRTKLATLKRPKNILFTKKKQLFTIANRLELLERKSKELFAGEKQLALLLEKKDEDISANVMAAVETKLKELHRDIGKAVVDKADAHLVLQFSHRIRDLEQAVRAANVDFMGKLSAKANQMQGELREQSAHLNDHTTRLRMLEEYLAKSNQDMATQFKDLLGQVQANQAAQEDTRRLLRKKADAKVMKELEDTMFKLHDNTEHETCAARCMSCMKDIVEPANPEHDPDALNHDVVHNSLTKKVNIGQFATKVYRSTVPLNAELVSVRDESAPQMSPLEKLNVVADKKVLRKRPGTAPLKPATTPKGPKGEGTTAVVLEIPRLLKK